MFEEIDLKVSDPLKAPATPAAYTQTCYTHCACTCGTNNVVCC